MNPFILWILGYWAGLSLGSGFESTSYLFLIASLLYVVYCVVRDTRRSRERRAEFLEEMNEVLGLDAQSEEELFRIIYEDERDILTKSE